MKKLLSVILAAVMLLSVCVLTGCGKEEEVEETPVVVEEGGEFTVGEWDGNVYTNTFAGLTYTMPEEWTHHSDEELANMMSISMDIVGNEDEFAKKIAELSTVYGMVARSSEGFSAQVVFENLTVTGAQSMDAKSYLEAYKPIMQSMYAQYGLNCTIGESTTVQIGGRDFEYAEITVDMNGRSFKQGYACRKIDNYICSIALTASSDEAIVEMLACFS